jgi:hypothetical protein
LNEIGRLRTFGAALVATVASACSPLPPYQSTAAKLVAASAGFSSEWKPLTKNYSAAVSAEERERGVFWLSSCVNELAGTFTPAPEGTVRASQIAECMVARGWHLVVREQSDISVSAAGVSPE